MAISFRVFLLALLLLAAPLIQVARCQSDSEADFTEHADEGGEFGIVGDDTQAFGKNEDYTPGPGVETTYIFPKNSARLVTAGEETALLVGLKNNGEGVLNIIAIKSSIHLPYDHSLLVQNLTVQTFNNASVPTSVQATYLYISAVSKYLQSGTFDLVATVIYEIDQTAHQNTFYNGTIEVIEPIAPLSIETIFLVTLGAALLVFAGLWTRGQVQSFSEKSKNASSSKVEVGTTKRDTSLDEWLQETDHAGYIRQAIEAGSVDFYLEVLQSDILRNSDCLENIGLSLIASYEMNTELEASTLRLILNLLCNLCCREESLYSQYWDKNSSIDGPVRSLFRYLKEEFPFQIVELVRLLSLLSEGAWAADCVLSSEFRRSYNVTDNPTGVLEVCYPRQVCWYITLYEVHSDSMVGDASQVVETQNPVPVPGIEGLLVPRKT